MLLILRKLAIKCFKCCVIIPQIFFEHIKLKLKLKQGVDVLIEITVDETEIRVDGHAGFGSSGQDIVCAAVSALFQTLVWSIEDLARDKITYEFVSGRSWLNCDGGLHEGSLSEEADLLVRSFFVGVNAIQEAYPGFVRIVRVENERMDDD